MLISLAFFYEKNDAIIKNMKIKNLFFSLSILLGLGGVIFGCILYYFAIKFGNSDNYLLFIISIISLLIFLCVFIYSQLLKNYLLIFTPKFTSSFWKFCLIFKNIKFLIILISINIFFYFFVYSSKFRKALS